MKYLVLDFETTGVGKDAKNGYRPYSEDKKPLPRANYPVQICAKLIDKEGIVLDTLNEFIIGAEQLDPWVQENCPNISITRCCRDGINFGDMLVKLANMIPDDDSCTIVAHNIQYDWDEVLLFTVREKELQNSNAFNKLKSCKRYCTCINDITESNDGPIKSYYFKKLQKKIGPNLKNLAKYYNVDYESDLAHDAEYDVDVTIKCLIHMIDLPTGN